MGTEYPCGCLIVVVGGAIEHLSLFPCEQHLEATVDQGHFLEATKLLRSQGKPVSAEKTDYGWVVSRGLDKGSLEIGEADDEQIQDIPQERGLVPQEEAEAPPDAAL